MPTALLTLEIFNDEDCVLRNGTYEVYMNVAIIGLSLEEKVAFMEKHAVHMHVTFTQGCEKWTPLDVVMKDVPAMLGTLESMGYKVVSCTSNSVQRSWKRDRYVWTLLKEDHPLYIPVLRK